MTGVIRPISACTDLPAAPVCQSSPGCTAPEPLACVLHSPANWPLGLCWHLPGMPLSQASSPRTLLSTLTSFLTSSGTVFKWYFSVRPPWPTVPDPCFISPCNLAHFLTYFIYCLAFLLDQLLPGGCDVCPHPHSHPQGGRWHCLEIFLIVRNNWGYYGATGTRQAETRDAAGHPVVLRPAPQAKNGPAQNVNRAEVERLDLKLQSA